MGTPLLAQVPQAGEPGVGLEPLAPQAESFLHLWVWGLTRTHPSSAYLFQHGFFISLVLGILCS